VPSPERKLRAGISSAFGSATADELRAANDFRVSWIDLKIFSGDASKRESPTILAAIPRNQILVRQVSDSVEKSYTRNVSHAGVSPELT
jgi:hypothetical protein